MEYGKFNSAEELLKGYTELEKSFTQKCQQLSELQKQIADNQETKQVVQDENPQQVEQNPVGTNVQPSPTNAQQSTADDVAHTVPNPIGADSQTDASQSASVTPPKVMTGGGNVSMALPNRPKTLKEASELAKKYFN